jgi:hypothetical protein
MYDDKHMLKVVQHATASALNSQEATATFLLLPNLDGKQHQRFSQNLHLQQGCLYYSWKYHKEKTALHATPIPAKQNTTAARSNMQHAHLSSLEQSCQGATIYKQTITVR